MRAPDIVRKVVATFCWTEPSLEETRRAASSPAFPLIRQKILEVLPEITNMRRSNILDIHNIQHSTVVKQRLGPVLMLRGNYGHESNLGHADS